MISPHELYMLSSMAAQMRQLIELQHKLEVKLKAREQRTKLKVIEGGRSEANTNRGEPPLDRDWETWP